MKSITPSYQRKPGGALDGLYATEEEFQRLFATEMTELFRLALHLTATAERAERCVMLAIKDCFESSAVAKQWVEIWARRMIVRNAIRLVLGAENALPDDFPFDAVSEFRFPATDSGVAALRESAAIMSLPDFDRLVFVICVLECYSTVDCALLLRRSPKDVGDACGRSMQHVRSFETCNHPQAAPPQSALYRSYGIEGRDFESGRHSLLD